MEKPIKMDDLGVPFTPIFWVQHPYTQMIPLIDTVGWTSTMVIRSSLLPEKLA